MTYRLEITRRAIADRDACFDFIFAKSPDGALRWLDAFEAAAAALLTQPYCGEAPESDDHEETIRQKLFKTKLGSMYRLLYIVRGDVIYVIHVRGAGQDVMRSDAIELPDESQDR
jgi:plasmid stabilization system protein ParE